jgi:hypothetical protein
MRKTANRVTLGTELELTELTVVQGGQLIIGPDPIEHAKRQAEAINKVFNEIRNLPSRIWHTITSWF